MTPSPHTPTATERTVQTTRFGTLTIDEELALSFPEGLVGFPGPHLFALVPHSKESPFLWLQDLEDGSLAFPVTALDLPDTAAPTLLTTEERTQLGLEPGENPRLLGVVSVSKGEIHLNRLGPIAVNIQKRIGRQLVLDLPLPPSEFLSPGG
ncbi:MAG: flagellar assembly protein FliW [Elusimicrobia bacterium]|jgi:flagellar assembly factor FliW|nr:flagellar assembly protein FliW [Elusimicrobiota bacterium]